MSIEDWEALPWWQQKVYYDGFVAEGLLTTGEDEEPEEGPIRGPMAAPPPPPDHSGGPLPPVPRQGEVDPVTATSLQLREMGLTVIHGGRV